MTALLDVFLLADEAVIPPQINTLDDRPDFFHALQRRLVFYTAANCILYPLPEIGGNLQVSQHINDLLIDRLFWYGMLRTLPVAAILAQATIVAIIAPVVPVRPVLAELHIRS